MILIYSDKITNRVEYTASVLFGQLLRASYALTSSEKDFSLHEGPRVYYGNKKPEWSAVHIPAHGFLHERGVHYFRPEFRWMHDMPVLFPMDSPESTTGFDLLSAVFYQISRYEEYLPHRKDAYGRFEAAESFAFKHGFLHIPVVNHYARMIREKIHALYPAYHFDLPRFGFLPTYDIDVAYAYRGRGVARTILGSLRSLVSMDVPSLAQRIRVLMGREADPFDTYDLHLELSAQSGIKPVYFFLLGDYGPFDKNLSFFSHRLFLLIKKLGDYAHIGIHPSYAASDNEMLIGREIKRLTHILHEDTRLSRQHFLKLNFPGTYQALTAQNIDFDFSMGYASQPGFRAGICSPYPFYDLESESLAPLIIMPFAVMDGTFRDYLGMTPGQALTAINRMMDEVEKVGGTFISLWHNDALCECQGWQGWREVYLSMYKRASQKHDPAYDPLHSA